MMIRMALLLLIVLSTPAFAQEGAYRHVTPADVGVKIGVGVVGPAPTEVYDGPMVITTATTIENKVVNGCLRIKAGNFVLRNSVVNCGQYALQFFAGFSTATIEYSELNCAGRSKMFLIDSYRDIKIRNNNLKGCEAFFFVNGALGTMVINNNYLHDMVGDISSHADGVHIGETKPTTGSLLIQGNRFSKDDPGVGATGVLFATKGARMVIEMRDNWFSHDFGRFILRCNDSGSTSHCEVHNNLWAAAAKAGKRKFYIGSGVVSCNRYDDGSFIGQDRISVPITDAGNCPAVP